MSPYCLAHDEWLIMKLCMYVGYHDVNNVYNFGGDPMTQLNVKKCRFFVCTSEDMSPYCSAHDEWLIMKLCMYVGYHDANNVSKFGGNPVAQLNLKTVFVYEIGLIAITARCRHRSMKSSSMEGHTSLSTALVQHQCTFYIVIAHH